MSSQTNRSSWKKLRDIKRTFIEDVPFSGLLFFTVSTLVTASIMVASSSYLIDYTEQIDPPISPVLSTFVLIIALMTIMSIFTVLPMVYITIRGIKRIRWGIYTGIAVFQSVVAIFSVAGLYSLSWITLIFGGAPIGYGAGLLYGKYRSGKERKAQECLEEVRKKVTMGGRAGILLEEAQESIEKGSYDTAKEKAEEARDYMYTEKKEVDRMKAFDEELPTYLKELGYDTSDIDEKLSQVKESLKEKNVDKASHTLDDVEEEARRVIMHIYTEAKDLEKDAEKEFKKGDYEAAVESWKRAVEKYRRIKGSPTLSDQLSILILSDTELSWDKKDQLRERVDKIESRIEVAGIGKKANDVFRKGKATSLRVEEVLRDLEEASEDDTQNYWTREVRRHVLTKMARINISEARNLLNDVSRQQETEEADKDQRKTRHDYHWIFRKRNRDMGEEYEDEAREIIEEAKAAIDEAEANYQKAREELESMSEEEDRGETGHEKDSEREAAEELSDLQKEINKKRTRAQRIEINMDISDAKNILDEAKSRNNDEEVEKARENCIKAREELEKTSKKLENEGYEDDVRERADKKISRLLDKVDKEEKRSQKVELYKNISNTEELLEKVNLQNNNKEVEKAKKNCKKAREELEVISEKLEKVDHGTDTKEEINERISELSDKINDEEKRSQKIEIDKSFEESRNLLEKSKEDYREGDYYNAREGFRDVTERLERTLSEATRLGLSEKAEGIRNHLLTSRSNQNKAQKALYGNVEPELDTVGEEVETMDASEFGGQALETPPRRKVGNELQDELPEHEVLEHIGSGGNADVHKIRLKETGEVAALKVPQWEGTLSVDVVEDFTDEAETWDKLDDHSNIVEVLNWGSVPYPWMILEYMDGSLRDSTEGASTDEKLGILTDVADALEYAHGHGVIHLDIKPENVLVSDGTPKIADWGLSQVLLTHTQTQMGLSAPYAAPEQLTDDMGEIDRQTDVYQLGVLSYELLTGRLPFDTEKMADLQRQILEETPEPPSQVNGELPKELDEVILKAMAKSKEERYDAVVLFRNAVQSV